MDLDNIKCDDSQKNFHSICKFCEKELKAIGLDYLYANIDASSIEYERCTCDKSKDYWNEIDYKIQQQKKKEYYKQIINQFYSQNYISKRLKEYKFENFIVTNINKNEVKIVKDYTKQCINNQQENGLIITGNTSAGKTHLAAAISNELVKRDKLVLMGRLTSLLDMIKETFKDNNWTTRIKLGSKKTNTYSCFPLYDWTAPDIWTAVSKLNLKFNEIYEQMYKNGVSIYEQRLCQPYGDDQKKGLDQFRALEYETWEKVLNRVHGVNFGNIYCRTSILGVIKTEKPESMTWQEYTIFLLESIGIYVPELRDHYYHKIKTFLNWYENKGIKVSDIKDEEDKKLENAKKVASWRRIARAIEHNDFYMKRLSFSQNKRDNEKFKKLKEKYKNLV